MGAKTEKESTVKKNFYSVREHAFCKNTEGNVKTETSYEKHSKDGTKIYHYEKYKELNGLLRKFTVWEEEINGQATEMLAIDLRDADGNYECLQMFLGSTAADSMLKRLPNVDITKELTLKIFKNEDQNNKDRVYDNIVIYQANEAGEETIVKPYWHKENKGSLPEIEKVGKGKNKKSDRTDRNEFYKNMCTFYNAQITDVVTATQRDGVSFDDLKAMKEEHSDYGFYINYKRPEKPAQVEETEENTAEEQTETETENTGSVINDNDDLPF